VLFTDIVGSTERAQATGDRRWRELLDAHDEAARRLVAQEGGRRIKSTGDGVLAVFDGPGRAIRCAVALRKELEGLGIEIRAGIHTGELDVTDDDVGGIAVHIAARIMAAAGPGEILVSRTVHDLVTGSGIALEDRGTPPTLKAAAEAAGCGMRSRSHLSDPPRHSHPSSLARGTLVSYSDMDARDGGSS
jgi:class 3 adenylate cyclase